LAVSGITTVLAGKRAVERCPPALESAGRSGCATPGARSRRAASDGCAQAFEICRGMWELAPGVGWRCILYPHLVSEELVRAMAESGCREVSLGFESASASVLGEMNKRFTPDDVRRTSELLLLK
jgi:hypothetical protein